MACRPKADRLAAARFSLESRGPPPLQVAAVAVEHPVLGVAVALGGRAGRTGPAVLRAGAGRRRLPCPSSGSRARCPRRPVRPPASPGAGGGRAGWGWTWGPRWTSGHLRASRRSCRDRGQRERRRGALGRGRRVVVEPPVTAAAGPNSPWREEKSCMGGSAPQLSDQWGRREHAHDSGWHLAPPFAQPGRVNPDVLHVVNSSTVRGN